MTIQQFTGQPTDNTDAPIAMRYCPRYAACSAPICPLDPGWRARCHMPMERICIWLMELAKPGGEELIAIALPRETIRFIAGALPDIATHWGAIRRALERSPANGSRFAAQQALGRSKAAHRAP